MFTLRDIFLILFGAVLGFGIDRIKSMLDRRIARRLSGVIGSAALLIVDDRLRRRLDQFNFRVHFVDLRVLRFQSFVDCRECSFQSLHFLMLFEELVEQHRVHGFVAHRV